MIRDLLLRTPFSETGLVLGMTGYYAAWHGSDNRGLRFATDVTWSRCVMVEPNGQSRMRYSVHRILQEYTSVQLTRLLRF